jgi:hypothetical protein
MYSLTQGRKHYLLSFVFPLVIGASLVCTAHASPASPQASNDSDVEAQEAFHSAVYAQRVVIDEENATTKSRMAWAGDYYSGDGLGANISLSLAPRSGVAATWQGCLGTYWANKGQVLPQADGSLLLKYEQPNDEQGIGFADHLVPVPWGDRMYMISEKELPAFASAVNFGDEPRNDAHGMFLMRQGDESRKVNGVPMLPVAQRSLIREVPLEVGVVSAKRLHDGRVDEYGCRYRLELDHGADDGLAVGTKLHTVGGSGDGRVTLEQVTPTRAVGAMTLFGEECAGPNQRPSARTRFTTGAYRVMSANDKP